MTDLLDTIKAVWNDKDDEAYRQDQSHWRGVGRWANDAAWQSIGALTLDRFKFLWRILERAPSAMRDLSVLEWGQGGGSNVFGLREVASQYQGVDISPKNLQEAGRMISAEGYTGLFKPVLLEGPPEEIADKLLPIDMFLSTAVFQHFPSKDYGVQVLKTIRKACKPDAAGVIQIRFDNGNPTFSGIKSVEEYAERHIVANSYAIDAFWDILASCGFKPLAVDGIRTQNNYATFYMTAK
ncbi:methyltransferase domain-containing protein [Ensifer sp. T173]|uniref:Methyltransferase domain-containing protein n=1 Tax=Ensifer canadensis TaxID=555315 RepID=A0AAW4FVR9_9HYPH|nr:class I SAM-dependent methyltransferase [Ensifer canadensis]MBM3095517.1 methyltransferase domain-containing protein [Ensifer canadensis]UBI79113.1 class I SAM-dependent methyltransferase [Ensifer canadensis]